MSALALASGLLLFLPLSFLSKLQLDEFTNEYGFILGLIFVVSLAILLITLFIQTFKFLSDRKKRIWFYKTAEDRLRNLTPYEMCIVMSIFEKENYTNFLPINDGAVKKLEYTFVIGKTTNQYYVSNPNTAKFPYLLQPWVIDKLIEKPNLLSVFENTTKEFIKDDNNYQLVYDSLVEEPEYS